MPLVDELPLVLQHLCFSKCSKEAIDSYLTCHLKDNLNKDSVNILKKLKAMKLGERIKIPDNLKAFLKEMSKRPEKILSFSVRDGDDPSMERKYYKLVYDYIKKKNL